MIMSSCSSSVSSNVSVLLSSLLTASSDATRVWLRAEMDRTVDPMIDSIFNRLTKKLANGEFSQSRDGGYRSQMVNPIETATQHSHQSHSIGYEPENDPEILAQIKREIKEEEREMALKNAMDNTTNQQFENYEVREDINHGQANNDTQRDSDEPEIEEELDDEQIMHIEEEDGDGNDDENTEIDSDNVTESEESSRLVENSPMGTTSPLNQPPVMRQSTRLTKRKKTDEGQQNEVTNRDNQEDTENDDEEITSRSVKKKCPHPGCQYETVRPYDLKQHHRAHLGIKPYKCKWPRCDYAATRRFDTIGHIRRMHFKGKQSSRLGDYVEMNEMGLDNPDEHDHDESEEEHDDGDNVEDCQEEVIPPVKRPRTSRPTTLSSTKQKQVVTLTLQCPQCSLMFTKDKFNAHMKERHSIGPFGCAVKNCKQSFGLKQNLSQHLAQSHQSTSQWHCNNCELHFTAYHLLSMHNILQHQFGLFQCSFPACTFTGEYRNKVYNHYRQHKTQKTFNCTHPGCQYQTSNKLLNYRN